MNASGTALSLAELAQLSAQPGELDAYSPLFGQPFLLLDLDSKPPADWELPGVAAALAALPCPSIGLAFDRRHALPQVAAMLDAVAESPPDLSSMLRNIRAHPLAAATLVQLLRHNENASIHDGLLAESLAFGVLQSSHDFRRYLATQAAPRPCVGQEPLALERTGDRLQITLRRPRQRNAYSAAMRDALYEALLLLASDASITHAVVSGEGDCFSIGGELGEFGLADDAAQAHLIRQSRPVGRLLAQLATRIEFRVHRACIGSGIEIPAFAGRVVATEDTVFQLPEITFGLIPGAGGTVSITRRIGRQRTAFLALSARRIRARTALEWGLIDDVIQGSDHSPRPCHSVDD